MRDQKYSHLLDVECLRSGLADRFSVPDEAKHLGVVRQICAFYRVLKEQQVGLPSAYAPGGEWQAYIEAKKEVYDVIRNGPLDHAADILRNFWRNNLGPIVSQYAYYPELAGGDQVKVDRFMRGMTRDYTVWRELVHGDPAELDVPLVGNPWGYVIEGRLIAPQALRFHNHSRQILNLVSGIGRPVVVEIGGGFGGMGWYLLRLGRGLTYIDVDLPETLILAAYFLLSAFPDRSVLLYDPAIELSVEQIGRYDLVLMPNYVLPQLPDHSADVFLNAFSLSEMPWDTIAEYIAQIQRCCRGYFLHNNVDRAGVVNRGFPRTSASRFPIDPSLFKLVYKKYDLYQGHDGDYREFLYERIPGYPRADLSRPS